MIRHQTEAENLKVETQNGFFQKTKEVLIVEVGIKYVLAVIAA
jgi:hypothetical protein